MLIPLCNSRPLSQLIRGVIAGVKFVATESFCGKGMAAEFKSFSSPHTNTGSLLN
jgi:hypothetical protein